MKPPQWKPFSKRLGSALVMTLVIIVLITVVTVGYLASVMLETKTAGSALDQEKAYGIAMIGVHQAMARVRDALGPWDDPYKNFATNPPDFYWSMSPGRITRWSYTHLAANHQTNFALFSGEPATTNLVNLNRPTADGSYPIIGGTNAVDLSVKWVNVLRDPSKVSSTSNAIIGRFAFWVDDEGAKINVNTADGTDKYTATSLGVGSPSEVSFEVLFGSATNGRALTKQIVQIARTTGFSSPREILQVTNVTADVYTDNAFSLTAYNRGPDLNVFGQPKMALLPVLGDAHRLAEDMRTNGITMRALMEIYPTPSQLPKYTVTNPIDGTTAANDWPLAFRQEYALLANGRHTDYDKAWPYTLHNSSYVNGMVLAKYLSKTNWPVFAGSSPLGFAGKYTARQIDSIAAQICNLGNRAISPDYPYVSDVSPGHPGIAWYMETATDRNSAPIIYPGFARRSATNEPQWTFGMGRSPKVTRLLLKFTTYGSKGTLGQTNYIPPKASLDIWLEWWLPAAFRGGTNFGPGAGREIIVGHRQNPVLNCADSVPDLFGDNNLPNVPAIMPDVSYWSDRLLWNNAGIDFRGNPPKRPDPDQGSAVQHPYALSNGTYMGTGPGYPDHETWPVSIFQMTDLKEPSREWYAGEIRCVRNVYGGDGGGGVFLPMEPDATLLQIRGGIAVRSQMRPGWVSDADPVPFDAVRGIFIKNNNPDMMGMWTHEPYNTNANSPDAPFETLRDRVVKSVIPIKVDIPVAPNVPEDSAQLPGAETRYVLATVKDPLVNKFPGDWNVVPVSGPPATMQTGLATTIQFGRYDEGNSWRNAQFSPSADPDSYWMPQIDSSHYAGQPPLIPRSARFPNIGYLQYVRTGIMPDDDTLPYEFDPNQPNREIQHGTPFRLLSYAPSTEQTNQQTTRSGSQAYPDWALLDLLYVPSTFTAYGGAYTNSTNLLYFGTYGGATVGRINPNGAVIYTTDKDNPQPNISRRLPMQAVFNGIRVNEQITGTGTDVTWANGTNVNAVDLAQAVENYIRTNGYGALRMPSEICNVPEIAAHRPGVNPTRNDLVRQTVGALTTQGNVFSVWAAGQAIQKNKKNNNPDEFEPGDLVLAEVRLRLVVERYLDPGADGVYGNTSTGSADPDNIPGTYDDPVDSTNHPLQPRYLYRVVSSEEIR